MALLGIDVSWAQGNSIDFARVAGAGVSFAFAKCTDGHTVLDQTYTRNRRAIPDAGLAPGAYHFLEPLNGAPVSAQTDWFVANADPNAIHALDVEAVGPLDPFGWVKRYRTHYPTKPLYIYTNPGLWRARSRVAGNGADLGPLWAAGYEPGTYVPGAGTLAGLAAEVGTHNAGLPWLGWTRWTFMQFTDSARVPGISNNVDGNLFNGTLADLKALTGDDVAKLDDDDRAWILAQLKAQGWGAVFGHATPHTAGELLALTYAAVGAGPLTPDDIAQAVAAKLTAGITVSGSITPTEVRQALTDVLSTARLTTQG